MTIKEACTPKLSSSKYWLEVQRQLQNSWHAVKAWKRQALNVVPDVHQTPMLRREFPAIFRGVRLLGSQTLLPWTLQCSLVTSYLGQKVLTAKRSLFSGLQWIRWKHMKAYDHKGDVRVTRLLQDNTQGRFIGIREKQRNRCSPNLLVTHF